MPKQNPRSYPSLNPIAHTYFEDPTMQDEQVLSVLETGKIQYPHITTNVSHPASEYLIRLELEPCEESVPVLGSNLLTARSIAQERTEQGSTHLSMLTGEAYAQAGELTICSLPKHAPRTFKAEPVTDVAVDDLI